MSLYNFEDRLQNHGKAIRNHITPPFDIESEELTMEKNKKIPVLALAIAAVCILGTTAFATYQYLSARQAAKALGDNILAENFSDNKMISETKTDGEYKATLLGVTSGKNISNGNSSAWDLFPERTYAVVAVEKTDGSEMTYDDDILVSPLIQGLAPWKYNIFTMNGSMSAKIIDGILYRIVEFDSIEYFADKEIYLSVLSGGAKFKEAYNYNQKTGLITVNRDYQDTNILFKLNIDKSKANPDKARQYLEELKNGQESDDFIDTGDIQEELNDEEVILITDDMINKN